MGNKLDAQLKADVDTLRNPDMSVRLEAVKRITHAIRDCDRITTLSQLQAALEKVPPDPDKANYAADMIRYIRERRAHLIRKHSVQSERSGFRMLHGPESQRPKGALRH